MSISAKVYVTGFGSGTAHWSGEAGLRKTLCGKYSRGLHSGFGSGVMCRSCAKAMAKLVEAAYGEANIEQSQRDAKAFAEWTAHAEAEFVEQAVMDIAMEQRARDYLKAEREEIEEAHAEALELDAQRTAYREWAGLDETHPTYWSAVAAFAERYQGNVPEQLCPHGINAQRRCSICAEGTAEGVPPVLAWTLESDAPGRPQTVPDTVEDHAEALRPNEEQSIKPGDQVRFREGFGEAGLLETVFTVTELDGVDNTLDVPRRFVGLKVKVNGRTKHRLAYVTDLIPA